MVYWWYRGTTNFWTSIVLADIALENVAIAPKLVHTTTHANHKSMDNVELLAKFWAVNFTTKTSIQKFGGTQGADVR